MANYAQSGNRWTAIYVLRPLRGQDKTEYMKLPYELCRFNVDENPDARPVIVPNGEESSQPTADNKIYEKIWFVDQTPFAAKVSFGLYE
jgi:hypothetical protein